MGEKAEQKEFIKFESINLERADDIAGRYLTREYGVTRAEMVLTNRCQLCCSYCQKRLDENAAEDRVSHEDIFRALNGWLDKGCRFLHFTGGEVTLCEHLSEYVEIASRKGAEVTMSTNGVNNLSVYEDLVKKGANRFHISLDTYVTEVFDKQVGVPGSFAKVIETIQLITRMRDEEHYRTGLVLNVCITPATFHDIVGIVSFMLSLKPNDVKLIPISQLKDKWGEYEEVYEKEYKPTLLSMVPAGEGFVMLRSRINSLVKKSFRGYNDKRTVPPCYLSQDERTIDPEGNYYGCYINYREGAAPIGNIKDDDFEVQSEKLRRNMMNFTNSTICQRYCADLTVLCNRYIDEKVREQDESVFHLSGDVNVTAKEYGNKAYVIERMYEEGIKVPESLYLSGIFLQKIFVDREKGKLDSYLSSLNEYTLREGTIQWITGQPMDSELLSICKRFVQGAGGKRFVVRSSSNLEDSRERSYAGAFETVLNLETAEDVAQAVRDVFVSKYTYLIDNPKDVLMGVILEEQVEADYSGVAFSKNPVTGSDSILITYSPGACEQVVSGRQGTELELSRKEKLEGTKEIPASILEEIRENILHVEKMLDGPADVEWAVEKGILYVLQARRMTAWKLLKKIAGVNLYVDSLDKALEDIDFGPLAASHKKYMEKHYHVRKKAKEEGIPFPEVGYLFYNDKTLTQEVFDELIPKSRIYKIVTEIGIRTLAKSDVLPFLRSLGNEDGIARIQNITITNACGNISVTENGNVYVEYLPGGFGGFMIGELPFSHYLLDREGNILAKEEKEYDKYWKFNDADKKFVETQCPKARYSLGREILIQMTDIAAKCEKVFQNPRMEWELEGDKVYLNDLSFENRELNDAVVTSKILSPGAIKGEIRVLDDIDEIKRLLKNRSIVAERRFYEARRSDAFAEYLKKHGMQEGKKYVIVSKFAYPSLSLFMDYSLGYVFEKGGVLSHMGIILREANVPGVIVEDATKRFRDGDEYAEDEKETL